MNTFAIGSLPVHFSVAKLFNFRWQYTNIVSSFLFIGTKLNLRTARGFGKVEKSL